MNTHDHDNSAPARLPRADVDQAAATATRDGQHGGEHAAGADRLIDRVAALMAAAAAVAADAPVLLRDLRRLRQRERAARLHAANLRAAARATLAAAREGEDDPLWYLRDEIDHPTDTGSDIGSDAEGEPPGGGERR